MILSNGLTLVARTVDGRIDYAVDLTGGKLHGWLFINNGEGYISERKLESWEIMQAEDQQHYDIVI